MPYPALRKWAVLCCLLFSCPVFSQTANLPKVLGSFTFQDSTYTFEFVKLSPTIFTIAISKVPVARNRNEAALEAGAETIDTSTEVPYQFSSFTPEVFHSVFLQQMQALFNIRTSEALRNKSTEVYAIINSNLAFLDDEPVTAYLRLPQRRINSYLQANTSNYYRGQLSEPVVRHSIHSISIETSEGAIKNIEVEVVSPANENTFHGTPLKTIRFKNYFCTHV